MTRHAAVLFSILLSLSTSLVQAQTAAPTSVVGVWLNAEKDGQIEVYQAGNKFYGKIIWMKRQQDNPGTPVLDTKNPDDKLKTRPLLNAVILTDFVYNDGVWDDGKIYDPKSGKTYSSTMKLAGAQLEIRGYIGVSLFGRTTVWTRLK